MCTLATFATLVGVFFTACQALPTLESRQLPGPGCEGLGIGSFNTASNFTLAAWNKTLPNANSTGVPLVLAQAGAGESFRVLSVSARKQAHPWADSNGVLADFGIYWF